MAMAAVRPAAPPSVQALGSPHTKLTRSCGAAEIRSSEGRVAQLAARAEVAGLTIVSAALAGRGSPAAGRKTSLQLALRDSLRSVPEAPPAARQVERRDVRVLRTDGAWNTDVAG
eukprot:6933434-Prymnesium_polylepis.1